MLNCDESRSLRGVDMLLTSNAGSGDVSLPAELRGGWEKKTQNGYYRGKTQRAIEYNALNVPKALEKNAHINSEILE